MAVLLAVPVTVLAAPSPASADDNFHWCEANGSYCIGAPDLSEYAPVMETATGRDIYTNLVSPNDGGFELSFAAKQSLCVAAANNAKDVVIHRCNGGMGVVWYEVDVYGTGYTIFQNREFPTLMLAGHDDGTQLQLKSFNNQPVANWYYKFK
jgi:hypothetical protein